MKGERGDVLSLLRTAYDLERGPGRDRRGAGRRPAFVTTCYYNHDTGIHTIREHFDDPRPIGLLKRLKRLRWEYRFLCLSSSMDWTHGRIQAAWKAIGYLVTGHVYCSNKKWRWCFPRRSGT